MTRPRRCCKIMFIPKSDCFKPQEVPMKDLEVIELSCEETEALRLKNLKNMQQTEAAQAMGISQSTFQRILSSAHKKTSEAIVYGKAIKIVKH